MKDTIDQRAIWQAAVIFGSLSLFSAFVAFKTADTWQPLLFLKPLLLLKMDTPTWWMIALGATLVIMGGLLAVNPFRNTKAYGDAHWATEAEVKDMNLYSPKGIIFGKRNGKYLRMEEPLSVILAAPPGTGKTAGIVIPTLLSCGNSMLINDVKGELYVKTSKRRSTFSDIVLFSPASKKTACWNPLADRELPEEWADKCVIVDRIATALMAEKEGSKSDSYFINEAKAVFAFVAMLHIHLNGETSIPNIRRESLSHPDFQKWVGEILDTYGEDLPPRIIHEGNRILGKADKEFSGVFGSFNERMAVFADDRVDAALSRSDFRLRDMRTRRTSVYVTIKNSDQDRLRDLLNLFFEFASLTFIDKEPPPEDYTVTFVLDEFPRLGKMASVHSSPAISRGYRYNTIFVLQSEAQAIKIYGKEGLSELLNTCAYHIVYPQNDVSVAERLSKSIGKTTRKKESESISNAGGLFSGSTSRSEEGRELVKAQDILSMPEGTMMILKQNAFETPVKGEVAWWFKDKALSALVEEVPLDL